MRLSEYIENERAAARAIDKAVRLVAQQQGGTQQQIQTTEQEYLAACRQHCQSGRDNVALGWTAGMQRGPGSNNVAIGYIIPDHGVSGATVTTTVFDKPVAAVKPRTAQESRLEKGPSLLHRIWHFITRDDGFKDYNKTKEIEVTR